MKPLANTRANDGANPFRLRDMTPPCLAGAFEDGADAGASTGRARVTLRSLRPTDCVSCPQRPSGLSL